MNPHSDHSQDRGLPVPAACDAGVPRNLAARGISRLIVCEKTNHWAVALRGVLWGSGIRVYETRHWAECWQELASTPATLLALELRSTNLEETVRGLAESRRCYPRSGAVVLTRREMRDCEWVLREAGALAVVFSPRDLPPLVRLAKYFCKQPSASSASFRDWVWDRIPWNDSACHRGTKPESAAAAASAPPPDLPGVAGRGNPPG